MVVLGGCTRYIRGGAAGSSNRPPPSEALVVEAAHPINGTNVNLGAGGVAENTASSPLRDCVIEVTGSVGGAGYRASTERDRLGAGEAWEWKVAFGSEADASNDDSVEDLSFATRAEYAE